MSKKPHSVAQGPWRRPQATVTRPNRSFGGYYRIADRKIRGKDFRGLPLQTAEDAVVAAVRVGYGVIDSQIERGLNMARRLRTAANRAGVVDTSEAITLAENLLNRSVLLGLQFLEGTASEPGSPIKRLVMAQYRLLGSLLGLQPDPGTRESESRPARKDLRLLRRRLPSTARPRGAPKRPHGPFAVRHRSGSAKRAVTVVRTELTSDLLMPTTPANLRFHLVTGSTAEHVDAVFSSAPKGPPVLEITTTDDQPSGHWRAAICGADGEQVGIIEIEL